MTGREVIKINQALELDDLRQIMERRWDTAEYGEFKQGKPTPVAIGEYIMLPATEHYMVIAYTRKNKVVLTVCDNKNAIGDRIFTSVPTGNIFFGIEKISKTLSLEKERKGPAQDVLVGYTKYMTDILEREGLAK